MRTPTSGAKPRTKCGSTTITVQKEAVHILTPSGVESSTV